MDLTIDEVGPSLLCRYSLCDRRGTISHLIPDLLLIK